METLPPPSPGVQVTGSELEVLSTVDVNFTPESTAYGVSAVKLTRSSVPFVVTFVRRVTDMVFSEELLSYSGDVSRPAETPVTLTSEYVFGTLISILSTPESSGLIVGLI